MQKPSTLRRLKKANLLASAIAVSLCSLQAGADTSLAVRLAQEPPRADLIQVEKLESQDGLSGESKLVKLSELSKKVHTLPLLSIRSWRTEGTRELKYTLNIGYKTSSIYNPAGNKLDQLHLRGFRGDTVNPGGDAVEQIPVIGPKFDLWPGQSLQLTLNNQLPPEPGCGAADNPNVPHCFNSTNMHTHGLWISPAGNSDNVFLKLVPGTAQNESKFEYEYNIPEDHPAGTFWYHPHLHGSTALQVSSGMIGPLIIRGDRMPRVDADGQVSKPGDIDRLLVTVNGDTYTPFKEHTVVMQQIGYACTEPDGKITQYPNGIWYCKPNQTGAIENYDQFGPAPSPSGSQESSVWYNSGRQTQLNGVNLPTFEAEAGSIERWRLIHAGIRDTISFRVARCDATRFRKQVIEQTPAEDYRTANEQFTQKLLEESASLEQFNIASDGLTRERISLRRSTTLQPGYREDLLMVFPEAGDYCIVDNNIPPSQTVDKQTHRAEVIGFVRVKPSEASTEANRPPQEQIKSALLAAAHARLPKASRAYAKIVKDLESDLNISAFSPHQSVLDANITGKRRTLAFRIISEVPDDQPFPVTTTGTPLNFKPKAHFEVGEIGVNLTKDLKLVNYAPLNSLTYDPQQIQQNLTLGKVDEWTLTSFAFSHPFHIHVNPFQIVSIIDLSSGKDVSADTPDEKGEFNQYAGMKNTWRDTIFVEEGYLVTVRSKYERYIGDFVLHCHILDHEDQGMMQNVRISLPDTQAIEGAPVSHHH